MTILTSAEREMAITIIERVNWSLKRDIERRAIEDALDAQYWCQVDAGAVGASLPLVDDTCEDDDQLGLDDPYNLCSICGNPAVERFIDGHARCAGHALGDNTCEDDED